ncbi:MAG: c-type heme family protein, partial [Nitrospirales bacterium]
MRTAVLSVSLGFCLSLLSGLSAPPTLAAKEEQTAQQLIRLLQVGRMVVSNHQDLINDPDTADKGFTGDYLQGRMRQLFHQETGIDPAVPDGSFRSELFLALLESAKAVIDTYQPVINKQGIGFKGVLPAVFARRVGEEFYERTGVRLKLTATEVRYPANKPDGFE